MNRRSFLTLAAGVGTSLALAGCTALFDASLPDELEGVEPDADQLPTPTVGDGDVTVDVYEDFGCPTCQEFQADVFPELEQRLLEDDEATYRHYDFPLPVEDESIPMANAARTVQAATGTDDEPAGQFFEYKRAVMDASDWSDEGLADLAEAETDIDPNNVLDGLEEKTYYPTLAADWNRGDENGVDSTPTVLVDGEAVEDPLDVDEIVSAVENAA